MNQPTEMMRNILKNEIAQQIIDYVSPIYGESYVALWLYEAIGVALSEVCVLAEKLRDETNPMTTELLMDYWENEYKLHRNSSLTMEQRRDRLIHKIRDRAPGNPKRLAESVSGVLGVPVEIEERVAKNTFRVKIMGSVTDFDKLLHAIEVLDKKKPAHLIYELGAHTPIEEADLNMVVATTEVEERIGVAAAELILRKTLEKAIKLGATVTVGERYFVDSESK